MSRYADFVERVGAALGREHDNQSALVVLAGKFQSELVKRWGQDGSAVLMTKREDDVLVPSLAGKLDQTHNAQYTLAVKFPNSDRPVFVPLSFQLRKSGPRISVEGLISQPVSYGGSFHFSDVFNDIEDFVEKKIRSFEASVILK